MQITCLCPRTPKNCFCGAGTTVGVALSALLFKEAISWIFGMSSLKSSGDAFAFTPGENFVRFGNSGLIPPEPPEPVVDQPDVGVVQGFVEQSNVNPVSEMTQLIMVQRSFENASALIRVGDQTLGEAVKALGS